MLSCPVFLSLTQDSSTYPSQFPPHCKREVDMFTVPSALMLTFMDPEALLTSVMLGSMLEDGLLQGPGAKNLAQGQLFVTGTCTAAELCLCLDDHAKCHVMGILRRRGCG